MADMKKENKQALADREEAKLEDPVMEKVIGGIIAKKTNKEGLLREIKDNAVILNAERMSETKDRDDTFSV